MAPSSLPLPNPAATRTALPRVASTWTITNAYSTPCTPILYTHDAKNTSRRLEGGADWALVYPAYPLLQTIKRNGDVFVDGTTTLTQFNTRTCVINGTFEFDFANPGYNAVRVNAGRFDVKHGQLANAHPHKNLVCETTISQHLICPAADRL